MKRRLPRWYREDCYFTPLGIILNIAIMVLLMWISGLGIYNYSLSITRTNCYNFGTRIDKLVTYDNLSWGNWDCFVKTEQGWIPRDNLREVLGND